MIVYVVVSILHFVWFEGHLWLFRHPLKLLFDLQLHHTFITSQFLMLWLFGQNVIACSSDFTVQSWSQICCLVHVRQVLHTSTSLPSKFSYNLLYKPQWPFHMQFHHQCARNLRFSLEQRVPSLPATYFGHQSSTVHFNQDAKKSLAVLWVCSWFSHHLWQGQ